jgi:DNA invertase Pin-like site-specific DNA recombinase
MNDKIQRTHLERRAVVYLRQSTLKQVHEHRESTSRQYALHDHAIELGWPHEQIDVIDDDLGQSGASTGWRTGFQRMAEGVAHGRVGALFALEVSRLTRSSADWHRLLELCGLADVVIVDEQAVYLPRDYNDRLLLGMKGQFAEAEQYWMRLRLEGGRLSKARRGELYFHPPAGYDWDAARSRFRFDADERVQRAVRLVFERFRLDGSAYAVVRYFVRHALKMPARMVPAREAQWVPPRESLVLRMLHNPMYAGAYVFGRHEERMGLVEGELRRRHKRTMAPEAWKSCLRDHHPAYISWEEFMANQRKIEDNRTHHPSADKRGAAREGRALLQGLALCGRCGRRMSTRYRGGDRHGQYQCRPPNTGGDVCFSVTAGAIDEAVAKLLLEVVQPPEIELGLAVVREVERQAGEVERQWKLRLDRARYDAQLAERRYKAVDPDNRVVARNLEGEWEEKLRAIEEIEREYQDVRRREKVELGDKDRARILSLSKDLSSVWHAPTTTEAERKNLLRMVVSDATLSPVEVPARLTRIQVRWGTGAVSDFTVPRRSPGEGRLPSPEVMPLLRALFAGGTKDAEIAVELNRRDLRTGAGKHWDEPAVQRVRYHHGLHRVSAKARRPLDQRADGLYSIHGVAARLQVKPGRVRYWVSSGLLQAVEGGGTGHVKWFTLDEDTVTRLEEAKTRHRGPSEDVLGFPTVDPQRARQ